MKKCKKCNLEKELTNFYIDARSQKHENFCKPCKYQFQIAQRERKKKILSNETVEPNKQDLINFKIQQLKEKGTITCHKCNIEKPMSEYYKRTGTQIGYNYECKECLYICHKNWRQSHPDICKAKNKKWRQTEKGKIYHNNYTKEREEYDIHFKLKRRFGGAINTAIQRNYVNSKIWLSILDFDLTQLKQHLESLFQPGMSWDNYGKGGWHIDHIIPQSWFKYENPTDPQFKACWALSNLQPKWEFDNLSKGNRFIG